MLNFVFCFTPSASVWQGGSLPRLVRSLGGRVSVALTACTTHLVLDVHEQNTHHTLEDRAKAKYPSVKLVTYDFFNEFLDSQQNELPLNVDDTTVERTNETETLQMSATTVHKFKSKIVI